MGRPLGFVTAIFAAAAFISGVAGQQPDPRKDFCRRFSHEAAVVGDRLYINNGQLNLAGRGGKNFTNNKLLWHDLKETTLDGVEKEVPILMDNLTKPPEVPSLIGGILWADKTNGRLFQYGGEWPDAEPPERRFVLWTYDVYNNSWDKIDVEDRAITRLSFGAGTAVEESGKGYYLGGWMSDRNNIDWLGPRKASNKLLEYDFVHNSWANSTGPADKMGRAEGVVFYLPVGDEGMLVHFGGVRIPNQEGGREEPARMSVVDIYDVAGGKWYTQNATGDVPESRRRFCGGIAYAPDRSSSNVYIYGGRGFGANETGYDDVYILTMPAFVWIKIFPEKGVPNGAYPHYDLSCSVVKNSQLLIIGGQFPKDPDVTNCDVRDKWGVHNLVMSKVKKPTESVYWNTFDPNRDAYTVPDDITAVIGGDDQGGATVTSPKAGFDYVDVQTLFGRTYSPEARAPTRTAPSSLPTNGTSTAPGKGIFSTPAKRATILVPATCGAALLAGLAFYLVRRHRQNSSSGGLLSLDPPGYRPYQGNHGAADSVATTSYTPTGTYQQTAAAAAAAAIPLHQQQQPPHAGYPPLVYAGTAYSDSGNYASPPLPPQELPQHGWRTPEPMSVRSPVPGHYPPPLFEGIAEARSPGPEMKEIPRGGR